MLSTPAMPTAPQTNLWCLRDGVAVAVAAFVPLLLYILTLPRQVVLEDDSLFLMVGSHLGIAHPPGYPLYTLILYLFMQLPLGGFAWGTPAFLGHLSSAVLGALTCGAIYLCARILQPSRLSALVAAGLFGVSEHFWSQAIIAEVYTLNALLFFTCYALILYGVRYSAKVWPAVAVVYGLSLANHWPLMLLSAPGLLLAAWPVRSVILGLWPRLLVAFGLSVALPYIWMVWCSWQAPLISFYGPIEGWGGFWHYLSRQGYSGVDASPSAGWGDRLSYLQWFGNEALWQLTLPGFGLALLGLFILFKRKQWTVLYSGLLVFLGNSVVLILLLGFDYDFFYVAVFRPYSLVCYGILALWLAVGLHHLSAGLAARLSWLRSGVVALTGLGLLGFSVQASWAVNNRADSDFAKRYADLFFDFLPQDAVLFIFGDTETGPLGYYHYVEGRRPDIQLMNLQGLVYGNRLFNPRLAKKHKHELLRQFVNNETQRRIFYTTDTDQFPHGQGVRHYGFVKEIIPEGTPGALELRLEPAAEHYFKTLLAHQPSDTWEHFRRNKLSYQYGQYLGYAVLSGEPNLLAQMQNLLTLAERDFFSLTAMAEILLEHGDSNHWQQIEQWLEMAEHMQNETVLSKERLAWFLYLQGFHLHRLGQLEAGITLFEESHAIYPHPENPSVNALKQLGRLDP